MKIPFALILTFGLVMTISKTSVKRVKGKGCMLDDNKVVFRMSNEKIKKNIKSTREKKGKAVVDL
ncbi:unnamed protein product [Musa banksii]